MTGLQDLPPELIRHVIQLADVKHPFITLCRQTTSIAAEELYTDLITCEQPCAVSTEYAPLPKIVKGIDNAIWSQPLAESSQDGPFGNEVKLAFLSRVTSLHHHFGKYICFRESSSDLEVLEHLTSTFRALSKANLVAFPNLRYLHLTTTGWSSVTPPNRSCALALASVSKPSICYWPFTYDPSELTTYPMGNAPDAESIEYTPLRFAEGHIPERVIHLPVKVPSIPLVYYGTDNIVSFSQLWDYPTWSVDQTVEYILSILHQAHPEILDTRLPKSAVNDNVDVGERERRSETRWTFLWVGRFTRKDGLSYNEMIRRVSEEM
nr:uncharacterized protein CI109_001858 [Kwoniella shandongensis]KAA5529918.1 hypothetical protein CI109_001858 [Kwoniella shandongensis]